MMDSDTRSRKARPWCDLDAERPYRRERLAAIQGSRADRLLTYACIGAAGYLVATFGLLPLLVAVADHLRPVLDVLTKAGVLA